MELRGNTENHPVDGFRSFRLPFGELLLILLCFFTFFDAFCTFCMFCKCFWEIGLHLLQMASTQLALPGVKMLTALLFLVDWCSPV